MNRNTKRALAFGAGIATVAATGIAFAASMTVGSSTLGAGTHAVNNNCDVTVSYASTDSSFSSGKYMLTGATVTPSSATNCGSKSWKLTVVDGTGTQELTGTFAASAVAIDQQFTAPLDANTVSSVAAVVTGGASS